MTNNFEAEYERYDQLDAALYNAETEEERDAIREAFQELKKAIEAKGETYSAFYRKYAKMRSRNNNHIDFSEVIWEEDVPEMIQTLRELGFHSFTVSSDYSGIVERVWSLIQYGCRLEGMVEINEGPDYSGRSEFVISHAFLFTLD